MAAVWTRINTLLLSLVLLAVLGVIAMQASGVWGGPLDPPGPVGPTDSVKLPGTPISGPTEVLQPGHYYLTGNITVPAAGAGIVISVGDVTLDLGGFTIVGDADGGDTGIAIGEVTGVGIANGIIRGVDVAVDAAPASSTVRIEDIMVEGSNQGFVLGARSVLEDCVITGTSGNAIELHGIDAIVRGCKVSSGVGAGVLVAANSSLIEGSVIAYTNQSEVDAGISILAGTDQTTVRGNHFIGNQGVDVMVGPTTGATLIIDNVLDCPTSIVIDPFAFSSFAPVNSSDPHTNRASQPGC